MELKLYTIFDSAVQAFMTPFQAVNDGAAIRSVSDMVNAPEPNNVQNHPEHFTLFKLGTFNDQNAIYTLEKSPKPIAACVELVNDTTKRYTNIDLEKIYDQIDIVTKSVLDIRSELEDIGVIPQKVPALLKNQVE